MQAALLVVPRPSRRGHLKCRPRHRVSLLQRGLIAIEHLPIRAAGLQGTPLAFGARALPTQPMESAAVRLAHLAHHLEPGQSLDSTQGLAAHASSASAKMSVFEAVPQVSRKETCLHTRSGPIQMNRHHTCGKREGCAGAGPGQAPWPISALA